VPHHGRLADAVEGRSADCGILSKGALAYGRFVHGVDRVAALVRDARELKEAALGREV